MWLQKKTHSRNKSKDCDTEAFTASLKNSREDTEAGPELTRYYEGSKVQEIRPHRE